MFRLADNLGLSINFNIPDFVYTMNDNDLSAGIKISLQDGSFVATSRDKFIFYTFNLHTIQKIMDLNFISYDVVSEISIGINEYIEVVNFFSRYFSYHLGCKISLQSIDLLV
jgi:hypothetical protein